MIIDVSRLPFSRQEALYPKCHLQAMWRTCFLLFCFHVLEFWEFSQFSNLSLIYSMSCWHGQVAPSISSTSSPIYAGANHGLEASLPMEIHAICDLHTEIGNSLEILYAFVRVDSGGCAFLSAIESPLLLPIGFTSAHWPFARPRCRNRGAMESSNDSCWLAFFWGTAIRKHDVSMSQLFQKMLLPLQGIDGCCTYRSLWTPHSTPGGWCTTHWVYRAYPGFGAISRVQWAVWVAQWWKFMEQQVSQVRWGSWSWYLVVGHQFDGYLTSSPHHM